MYIPPQLAAEFTKRLHHYELTALAGSYHHVNSECSPEWIVGALITGQPALQAEYDVWLVGGFEAAHIFPLRFNTGMVGGSPFSQPQ